MKVFLLGLVFAFVGLLLSKCVTFGIESISSWRHPEGWFMVGGWMMGWAGIQLSNEVVNRR